MPSKLVEALMRFNRKERYWLLSDALGKPFLNLDPALLKRVSKELSVDIPPAPWWAFDYHIDWLHAVLSSGPLYDVDLPQTPRVNDQQHISGTQEDIDLLVAFDNTIILIEAKMDTSWSNKQMRRKTHRFQNLPVDHVKAHLLLTSPSKTARLDCSDWPTWARREGSPPTPYHIALTNGHSDQAALMVSRCGLDGQRNSEGTYWNVFEA